MLQRDEAWLRHQQTRWLRPDAYRWLRPDAARFLKPGSDPAEIYPAWELKYNASQPRVPAGNPDGGQWTSGGGFVRSPDGAKPAGIAQPMGNVAIPDVSRESTNPSIAPSQPDRSGVRLAGDLPEGSGPSPGVPGEEPPPIPPEKPKLSAAVTNYLRSAADWLAKHGGLPGDIYLGSMNNVKWLREYHDLVQAGRDGPKSMVELQSGVDLRRPGYQRHHIAEQTSALNYGFSRSEIDDPSNLVSIPILKHYQITGWFNTPSEEFGGLSPRAHLRDKGWAERRRIGLDALVRFKVLTP